MFVEDRFFFWGLELGSWSNICRRNYVVWSLWGSFLVDGGFSSLRKDFLDSVGLVFPSLSRTKYLAEFKGFAERYGN